MKRAMPIEVSIKIRAQRSIGPSPPSGVCDVGECRVHIRCFLAKERKIQPTERRRRSGPNSERKSISGNIFNMLSVYHEGGGQRKMAE
jgi:hypothetical protein